MLRGGLPIIHPLSNVPGSAADRSTSFLLNGVVGDMVRARTPLHAEPGGMITFFSKKSGLRIKKADLVCLRAGFWSLPPAEYGWQRRGKIGFLFAQRRSGRWTARVLHLHFTQSRAG